MNDVFHKWRPIEDLPENWQDLADPKFARKLNAWRKTREKVKHTDAFLRFNDRLRREFAIETNVIEGVFSIDAGTTETLIEKGFAEDILSRGVIDRPANEIIEIFEDHQEAVDLIFDYIRGQRPLAVTTVRELHALVTRHQKTYDAVDPSGRKIELPLTGGAWKTHPNNPTRLDGRVHQYCPPEFVDTEMARVIELHRNHDEQGVAPEVAAAWLHHAFVAIHPFPDGNGRTGRLLASLVMMRAGGFMFSVKRDVERDEYIAMLDQPNKGDLLPLCQFIRAGQNRRLEQAAKSLNRELAAEIDLREITASKDIELLSIEPRNFRQEIQIYVDDAWEEVGRFAAALEDQWGKNTVARIQDRHIDTEPRLSLVPAPRRRAVQSESKSTTESASPKKPTRLWADMSLHEFSLVGHTRAAFGILIRDQVLPSALLVQYPFFASEDRFSFWPLLLCDAGNGAEYIEYHSDEDRLLITPQNSRVENSDHVREWVKRTLKFLLIEWKQRREALANHA